MLKRVSEWLTGWFDPKDPDLRRLRYDQLMHVIGTGESALVSSLATVLAIAWVASLWHSLERVAVFVAVGAASSVIAQVFYWRAKSKAAGPESYRACNAAYVTHAFFTVVTMLAVAIFWLPGELNANAFVMLVLVVCATVRAAHQAAHLPSTILGLLYFAVGIGLCVVDGTRTSLLMAVLGVVVMLMLADLMVRMHRTIEAMLTLRNAEHALLSDQERLVSQLRQANYAKTQFMARMSHELRTPLNAVIGFSDLMLQQSKGPVGAPVYIDYLKYIHSSGTHLLQLINDILDLSKMEAGRYELREGEVDVWEAVEDACSMMRLRAEEGGVTLLNDIPRGIDLKADVLALRQIAINLASNAVKFTPPGGRARWHGEIDAVGRLVLQIDDTGFGIPAKDLEVIFEPFGQSSSGYEAAERGTGLGLPIVRSLMELHGGTAEISSAVGGGTEVTLTFPASRVGRVDKAEAA